MKLFLIFMIFNSIIFVQGSKFKSFSDYVRRQIMPSLEIRSKTIIVSTTPIVNKEVFGDTLGEKMILAAVSSFITALCGYIFVCIFKCVRNDGHFKKNWFVPKIQGYYHRHKQIEPACQTSTELVVISATTNELI